LKIFNMGESKVNMSLDDIIRQSGGKFSLRGRRGNRAMGGRGRFGKFRGGFRSRGTRRTVIPPGRWQHDKFHAINGFGGKSLAAPAQLLVSNLNFNVTNDDVKELFQGMGAVRKAAVHYDERGRSMGLADVVYHRRVDAMRALKEFNNIKLDGRPMRIEMVKDKSVGDSVNAFSSWTNSAGRGNLRGSSSRGNRFGGGRGGRVGRGRGRGPTAITYTAADLDAELDAYKFLDDADANLNAMNGDSSVEQINSYQVFLQMEELQQKLKILNVDEEFVCKSVAHKYISRHYFAVSTNPGEQFFMFVTLAAWLIRKCGFRNFKEPQEHDDPNVVVSGILDAVKRMGRTAEFLASRLLVGAGEPCVRLLSALADEALEKMNFKFQKPTIHDQTDDAEDVIVDGESEIIADSAIEEDYFEGDSDNEDELCADVLQEAENNIRKDSEKNPKHYHNAEFSINQSDWKKEVERVTPLLKIVIKPDYKDWKMCLEQLQKIKVSTNEISEELYGPLEKISIDAGRTIEKIRSREIYINGQLEQLLKGLSQIQNQLAEAKESYRESSAGLVDQMNSLNTISDELEQVQEVLNEKMTRLADGAPLIQIRQAVSKLKKELVVMEIQLTVIQQMLFQANLKRSISTKQDSIILHP
ncbi:Intraflagellar transport protein 57 -like protein, partial [Trichinella spiralis]